MTSRKIVRQTMIGVSAAAVFYMFDRIAGYLEAAYNAASATGSGYDFASAAEGVFQSIAANPLHLYTTQNSLIAGALGALAVVALAYCASGAGGGYYKEGAEHGTAELARPSSLAQYADKNSSFEKDGVVYDSNMILSANVRKRLDYRVPLKIREFGKVSNVMVFAESGGGKTWEYVLPNCLQLFGSIVIVDTKGDIYKNTANFYRQAGYKVRVLNVTDGLLHTDPFNFMKYMRADEDIPEFIDTLVAVTTGEKENMDWFAKAEGSLIKALASYAWEAIGEPNGIEVSIVDIMELLNQVELDSKTGSRPFEAMVEELEKAKPGCMAKEHYRGFKAFADSPKTTASILGSVHVRLQNAKTKGAKAALSRDAMDLENLTRERTALFVIIDDEEPRPYQFVSALFFSTLTKVISRQAKASPTGRVDVPVHLMIDETRNVGKIATLTGAISQIRSKGGSISTVWQNYGQAVEVYGKEGAQTLWQNSPTKIFLGGDDPETNEMLSKTFGEMTAKKRSRSKTKGRSESSSVAAQTLDRRVVMADELGRLKPPYEYVKVSGFNVVRDKRFDVTKHPNFSLTGYANGDIANIDDIATPRLQRDQAKGGGLPMGVNPSRTIYIDNIEWLDEQ